MTLPRWLGDFSTGDLTQWESVHAARPEQVHVAADSSRPGYRYTGCFTVAPGDEWNGLGTERAEVRASDAASGPIAEGVQQWYAWSSYFTPGTAIDPGGWLLFTQWHSSASTGSPNVGLYITDAAVPRLRLQTRGQSLDLSTGDVGDHHLWDLVPLPTGRWVDFRLYVKWSSDPKVGGLSLFIDDVLAVGSRCATLYAGYGAYLKQGIYRSPTQRTHVFRHTGMRRGMDEASVAL